MKIKFDESLLPEKALLISCSSHEPRCEGLTTLTSKWFPKSCVLFHYDDENVAREVNHAKMTGDLENRGCRVTEMVFSEKDAVLSLHNNIAALRKIVAEHDSSPIILDISVLTKRHLLMLLRWLDDSGYWDKLVVIYTEPEEYDVTEFVPLSFGLRSMQQIPGFSAAPDLSRPVHLVLFLGYEGDRSLAVYEQIQPMQTTLMLTHPPYRPDWEGRSETLNRNLISLVGRDALLKVDGIDPELTKESLNTVFADRGERSSFARIICPTGTKPQTLGIYSFVREMDDCAAIVYASPLRHNHTFFSHGIGTTWILKMPK